MISDTHAGYAAFGIGGTPSSHDWCAGVDLRTVMDLAGHKTIQMTMRYAHLGPGHAKAAVGKATATTGATSAVSQDSAVALIDNKSFTVL
jgi:hypothetical protein